MDYLHHTLAAQEVKPNESKIAGKEFPKCHLSLSRLPWAYVVIFTGDMATIGRPLTALAQKDLCGNLNVMKHYTKIKHLLAPAPLLHPPNPKKEFFL